MRDETTTDRTCVACDGTGYDPDLSDVDDAPRIPCDACKGRAPGSVAEDQAERAAIAALPGGGWRDESAEACAVCGRRLSFGCIHTADGSAYGDDAEKLREVLRELLPWVEARCDVGDRWAALAARRAVELAERVR